MYIVLVLPEKESQKELIITLIPKEIVSVKKTHLFKIFEIGAFLSICYLAFIIVAVNNW